MATLTAPAQWNTKGAAKSDTHTLIGKWNIFMENQAERKTLWFLVSLMVQGVFFLPVPAALVYYFHAPVPIVIITLTLFFANIIAGMGGAGIKTLLWLFVASIAIHTFLVLLFVL